MKKCFIALLAVIASLLGCDGPSGTEILGEIQLSSSSKDVIEIDSDGSTESVRFSSALDWYVECTDTWLTIDPMEGGPGTARISIRAGQNDTKETRQTVVTICSEGFELPITVTQEPFLATFDLLDVEKEVSCLGGEIVVSVYTDVDFSYECQDDWVKGPSTKAPRTRQVAFTVEPNTLPQERTTVITFVAGDVAKEFTLTQRAAGTESDDWKKDQFVHRSLAMRFTATWCGYCPMLGRAFESAKAQMNGSLELVSLHGSDSNYEFSGTNTLASRFRVQGFPTGVVDARATINNEEQSVTSKDAVDVAKETASMIVVDDNFTSIVSGVKEGRTAYSNIRKITLFLLSCGFAEVCFFLLSIAFGYEIPLLAIQLLWLNIVTDGLQDIALSFEKAEDSIMKEKPRDTKESLFSKDLMIEVGILGLSISLIIFITWKLLIDNGTSVEIARAIIMMLMVFIQNINVLNCRSEKRSVFKESIKDNPLVIGTILFSIALQLFMAEIPITAKFLNVVPLPILTIVQIFALSLLIIVVFEVYKAIYNRTHKE